MTTMPGRDNSFLFGKWVQLLSKSEWWVLKRLKVELPLKPAVPL